MDTQTSIWCLIFHLLVPQQLFDSERNLSIHWNMYTRACICSALTALIMGSFIFSDFLWSLVSSDRNKCLPSWMCHWPYSTLLNLSSWICQSSSSCFDLGQNHGRNQITPELAVSHCHTRIPWYGVRVWESAPSYVLWWWFPKKEGWYYFIFGSVTMAGKLSPSSSTNLWNRW